MARPLTVLDTEAREAAIEVYERLYENFAESAQLYAGTELGHTVANTAMLFLVAADAEANDPVPSVAPSCACVACRMYVLLGPKGMPALESFTGIGR